MNKNRNIILLVILISFVPLLIAWYFSKHPEWFTASTNKGELVMPVVMTEADDFKGKDTFSRQNITELRGHWVLLHIIVKPDCDEACQQDLHKTHQLRLMMNKDLTRIRRAIVFLTEFDLASLQTWLAQDQRLLRLQVSDSLAQKIHALIADEDKNGWLLLMDPLGNIMMKYRPGFDVYDVKKDLGKLLRISQIG